jgi:hypothetical protein
MISEAKMKRWTELTRKLDALFDQQNELFRRGFRPSNSERAAANGKEIDMVLALRQEILGTARQAGV